MLGESIDNRACNTVTLQPGRIGTVTDIIALCDIAQKEQWAVCIASDSGDTSDDYLADLAVGVRAGMLRAGAVEHGQHVGKYNQLLRIEEELSAAGGAEYVGDRFRDPL
jgi:enolase